MDQQPYQDDSTEPSAQQLYRRVKALEDQLAETEYAERVALAGLTKANARIVDLAGQIAELKSKKKAKAAGEAAPRTRKPRVLPETEKERELKAKIAEGLDSIAPPPGSTTGGPISPTPIDTARAKAKAAAPSLNPDEFFGDKDGAI